MNSGPDRTLDSAYGWRRVAICLAIGAIGNVGLWSSVVSLPAVQLEFGASRADASLPYTLTIVGAAVGGVVMGRLADRFGIVMPLILGTLLLAAGYAGAAASGGLLEFSLAHGLLIGFGASTMFSPLMSDISHWFLRRRGIAVAIVAAGNYAAGALWPPILTHAIEAAGWRATHYGLAVGLLAIVPLSLLLRPQVPDAVMASNTALSSEAQLALGISPRTLQVLICIAGLCCCTAMAMPQVHIVAYCGDLGYGVARGAQMLSLMLGFGIISRIATGFIADRIGGVLTLLVGSSLQAAALALYLAYDGLTSLYVISALFGLFQGGIVPSYAIIIREYFPPREAGVRVGFAVLATLVGMGFGGWVSGKIFDLTGSYAAAFANGLAFNLVNLLIALWLLMRTSRRSVALA